MKRVCEEPGGEDTEKAPFRGETNGDGETAVRLGLGGNRSSIREWDCELYQSGPSTSRSRFGKFTH